MNFIKSNKYPLILIILFVVVSGWLLIAQPLANKGGTEQPMVQTKPVEVAKSEPVKTTPPTQVIKKVEATPVDPLTVVDPLEVALSDVKNDYYIHTFDKEAGVLTLTEFCNKPAYWDNTARIKSMFNSFVKTGLKVFKVEKVKVFVYTCNIDGVTAFRIGYTKADFDLIPWVKLNGQPIFDKVWEFSNEDNVGYERRIFPVLMKNVDKDKVILKL